MRHRYSIALAAVAVLMLGTSCASFIPGLLPATPSPVLFVTPMPTATRTFTPVPTSVPLATPGTPTLAPGPAASPSGVPVIPTATPQAQGSTSVPRRITFPAGGTAATVQGVTATPGMDRFVLRALGGQTMTANISSTQGPVILIIYAADGNVLISDHAGAATWTGTLPSAQDYFIDTRSVGDARVSFTLQVIIPPVGAEAGTPIPKRIAFQPGDTSTTVQNTVAVNAVDRWVLRALAGQTMTVNSSTTSGQVILIIWGVQDGNVLISDHAGATSWSGRLPTMEDYYIDVRSVGSTAAVYSLQVTIPPP